MEITLLLVSLEESLPNIQVQSPECIHLLDRQGNVISTILSPCQLDEEALSAKKILYDKLDNIVRGYSNQDSAVESIVVASILPSIFLAEYYSKKIKLFAKSFSAESFQVTFKDSNAVNREPLSQTGSGMSILSIYLLKYALTFGFKKMWNHLIDCFTINIIPDALNQAIPLYTLLRDVDLDSINSSNVNADISKEFSSCLVIGDGLRARYHSVLTDPNFYTHWIKSGMLSSYLICTENTPLLYSKTRIYSPLSNLLLQLHDGEQIIKYLLACILFVRNRIKFYINKLNIKMIAITDSNPDKALTIAITLSVANEMNLKVSIINHSIGPVLFRTLSKSRGSRDFDILKNLSYGCAYYFVQVGIFWDPLGANLQATSRDISILYEPRLSVFVPPQIVQNKSIENSLSPGNILMISTEFYHAEHTHEYLRKIILFCNEIILQSRKCLKYNSIYIRFRGDSILFIPPLLQSVFGFKIRFARKIYMSRSLNCVSINHERFNLHIGFDGKHGTHTLLHMNDSLSHLHIGISSSLMYESMQCLNNVVYLPTESKDFLPEHYFIKQQPFVADSLNHAIEYLLS